MERAAHNDQFLFLILRDSPEKVAATDARPEYQSGPNSYRGAGRTSAPASPRRLLPQER